MTELVFKICAVAVFASFAALLLKSREPELSMLLTVCTSAIILAAAFRLGEGLRELMKIINRNAKIEYTYISPVFKCAVLGIALKIAASVCSDSSQRTLTSALELCGAMCIISVSMPILTEFITLICRLI